MHRDDNDSDAIWNDAKSITMEAAVDQIRQKEWRMKHKWFGDEYEQTIDLKNIASDRIIDMNTRNNAEIYHSLRKDLKNMLRRKKRQEQKAKIR